VDAPDVIELAYAGPLATPRTQYHDNDIKFFAWKPNKPITLGAMATHHIIDADLQECLPWPGSWLPPAEIGPVEYAVAHNCQFDWDAIGKPAQLKQICTLALARKAWPLLDSHKLGAIMYHLYPQAMARDWLRKAHSATADVSMLGRLLFTLTDIFQPRDWAHLYQISEVARVPTVMSFGKYGPADGKPGMPIPEMRRKDPGYVRWLLANADIVKKDLYWQKALTQ
jgi:exodeoxyribonuclease X